MPLSPLNGPQQRCCKGISEVEYSMTASWCFLEMSVFYPNRWPTRRGCVVAYRSVFSVATLLWAGQSRGRDFTRKLSTTIEFQQSARSKIATMCKEGRLEDAVRFFRDEPQTRSVYSASTLISACGHQQNFEYATDIYRILRDQMAPNDAVMRAMVTAARACCKGNPRRLSGVINNLLDLDQRIISSMKGSPDSSLAQGRRVTRGCQRECSLVGLVASGRRSRSTRPTLDSSSRLYRLTTT